MDQSFIESQKQLILSEIENLESEVKSAKYDEIGSSGDDNAVEFEEFEESVALGAEAKKELKELKSALKRIEDGSYGKCEKCGILIEAGRLKAFPASRFCATHAS